MSANATSKRIENIARELAPVASDEVVVVWDEVEAAAVLAAAALRGDIVVSLTWGDDDEIKTEVIEPRSEALNI